MKNIIMLAGANIRKSKSQAISLLLFVLIAAMFLNIGLVLFINYGKAFDQRAEQLHAPHAGFLQAAGFTKDQQLSYLKQYPGSVEVEKQPVISALGDYYMNDLKAVAYLIIANAAWGQEMNPPSFIGESRPLDDHSIYVPYLIKTAGGYELGDHYRLNLSGTELNFTIAGFTEEIMFGSAMNNIYRFYVSNAAFENLEQRFPELQCYLQSVRMEESGLGTQIWQDYLKEFVYSNENTSSLYVIPVNYDDIKSSRVIIPTITALIVVAFAAILLAVSLIVIRFRIVNSIEEDMTNIGILKAVGYKNNQIISSILMQFGGITLIGGLSGIAASQLILPLLSRVLEAQSALIWNPGFDFIFAAITLFFVLLSIALVSFMTAKRIYKLHPLIALRGGLETHNFKKNRISLDQSYGGLSFLMAMKHLVQNKKQAVMIAIIMTAVSFASIVGLAMYYNIGVDLDSFVTIITGEKPDASLILKDPNDTQRILEKLQKKPEVRKAFSHYSISLMADEVSIMTDIVKDPLQLEGGMLYDGRYPKHVDEVAVGGNVLRYLDKKIGDTIHIKQGDTEKEFLITGTIQSFNNQGMIGLMTNDGITSIQSDFQSDTLYIYLNDSEDVKAFIENVKTTEGDIFGNTIDMQELIDSQLGSLGSIFGAVTLAILMITILVVILVLYMVIKATILRRKREFGIQKALGFTTLQLMNQIALHFTPTILIGVVIGGIAGYNGFNPIFTVLTSSAGIMTADMPSPLGWTIVTCLVLVGLAYAVSILVAWRIRKISAYGLINE